MWQAERNVFDVSDLLQQQTALDQIGAEILNGGPRAVRYSENREGGTSVVFVAHRDDVVRVLTCEKCFSVCHYNSLYSAVAPPGAAIIMRPEGPVRAERMAILKAAADKTPWFKPNPKARRLLARKCVDHILATVGRPRSFDLIAEYGFFAPYLIAKRIMGLAPPRSFSLVPLLICLANRHPLAQAFAPKTAPYLTDLAWSEVVVAQLLGNFEDRSWIIRTLARFGATQLRRQIESQVDAVPKAANDRTLLSALWAVQGDFDVEYDVYREHVVSIMMELAGTILVIPGLGFSGAVDRWLQPGGPGLQESLSQLTTMNAQEFVQEQLRLAPPAAKLLRNATATIGLGGLTVKKGEYVCALVKAAGADIPDPDIVKAGRCPNTYLHFGPENGPHRCFGHLLSPVMLAEMFLGLTRLTNLTPHGSVTSRFGSVPGRLMVDFDERVGTTP
jgi:hypothetical protein